MKNRKYRHVLARLRTSSHNLEIERGRHTRPVTPADLRICTVCNVVEDEEHLLLHCVKYAEERNVLFSKIVIAFPDFNNLSSNDKLVFLISSQDPYILTLVAKFLYSCFQQRNGHAWYLRLLLYFTNFYMFLWGRCEPHYSGGIPNAAWILWFSSLRGKVANLVYIPF